MDLDNAGYSISLMCLIFAIASTIPFTWACNMSHDMRFPTMWYARPAKAQTSLRICAD